MEESNLYSLSKDLLVKLIYTIQGKTIQECQRKAKEDLDTVIYTLLWEDCIKEWCSECRCIRLFKMNNSHTSYDELVFSNLTSELSRCESCDSKYCQNCNKIKEDKCIYCLQNQND